MFNSVSKGDNCVHHGAYLLIVKLNIGRTYLMTNIAYVARVCFSVKFWNSG